MPSLRLPALGAVALAATLSACAQTAAIADAPAAYEDGTDWSLQATPLDRDAAQLAVDTDAHLAAAEAVRAHVMAVQGPRTVDNTLRPLDVMWMHIDAASNACQLLESVHPREAVRDAAEAGTQRAAALGSELSLDRQLYEALRAVDLSGADAATRHAVDKQLLAFRLAGVDQDDATRARIKELNAEILAAGQAFAKVIAEDQREVPVDPAALAGLPDDWVEAHPANDRGVVMVDTTYPDYIPFMTYSESPQARFKLYMEYRNRGYPENLEHLDTLIRLREEKARLLGYEHWADWVTADKMIGSGENAAYNRRVEFEIVNLPE